MNQEKKAWQEKADIVDMRVNKFYFAVKVLFFVFFLCAGAVYPPLISGKFEELFMGSGQDLPWLTLFNLKWPYLYSAIHVVIMTGWIYLRGRFFANRDKVRKEFWLDKAWSLCLIVAMLIVHVAFIRGMYLPIYFN